MLTTQVKENLTKAMKARSMVEVTTLRVLLSNFQTQEATQGKALTEDQEISVVKKLIKQNEEEIATRTGHDQYAEAIAKLQAEIAVLSVYLPSFLSADKITAVLSENIDAIKAAKNAGAATGVAMKLLKDHGKVEGQTVKDVVEKLYSA